LTKASEQELPTQIHVRGTGGQIITMDLPLNDAMQQQLDAGTLQRVNVDGSPYTRRGA
jgi:hypothetical protein